MSHIKIYRVVNKEGMYFKYNYYTDREYEWVGIKNAHLFKNKEMALSEAAKYNAEVEECFIVSTKDLPDD